jgi:hypothetical protein
MKNNYVTLGLIFGAGIGLSVGVLTESLAIWLSIGAGAGLTLGAGLETYLKGKSRDCKVRKSNHD